MSEIFSWVSGVKKLKEKWPVYNSSYYTKEGPINLYQLLEVFNDHMSSETIIVTDAGSPSYALPQNLKSKINQRFVFSSSQADMGCAVPAGIGVSHAAPDKNIVVITGDGSFNSNIQELANLHSAPTPIKVIVLNNDGYLSIKNTQKKFFENRVYGVDAKSGLWFPEISNIAKAYSLDYLLIDSNKKLQIDIEYILNKKTPMIVEVICQADQEILPTQMLKEVDGKKIQPALDDMYPFLSHEEIDEARKILGYE
ncbi:thiamine pyrophosphate-binding protein [bacterium]|nr:thiamine pyrophosphate-binding protein [bacterium]